MRLRSTCAALAAIAVSAPAMASASADAALLGVTFTLYDTNLADGVTPWVSFAAPGTGTLVSSSAFDPLNGYNSSGASSALPFGNVIANAASGLSSSSAYVVGSLDLGLAIGAEGVAGGNARPDLATGTTSFSALSQTGDDFSSLTFTLSSNTILVISATANVRATTTVGAVDTGGIPDVESANASVYLSLSGRSASGAPGGTQISTESRSVSASYGVFYDPETGQATYYGQENAHFAEQVAVSFLNVSGNALTGTLTASASVSGYSPVSAVPEPSTYAMLAAGLAVIGSVARRRSQRA